LPIEKVSAISNNTARKEKVMKRIATAGMFVMLVAAALQFGGCAASYQARSVELKESSPLVNPELFKEGQEDQALYRYVKPGVDVKSYTKVMIDPVLIMKDGELDKDELENYQKLANNGFIYLTQALEKDYKIVTAPEPGTFRVQMAIVDADTSKPVRNTLGTFFPIGIGISLVRLAATGKQTGVGEITAEMKFTDATTGELLAAALDRRVGGHKVSKLWSSWYTADEALKFWAQQMSYALCKARGDANCVKPEAE
jgi:hypothetical protein